jgi:hypothetical protein
MWSGVNAGIRYMIFIEPSNELEIMALCFHNGCGNNLVLKKFRDFLNKNKPEKDTKFIELTKR